MRSVVVVVMALLLVLAAAWWLSERPYDASTPVVGDEAGGPGSARPTRPVDAGSLPPGAMSAGRPPSAALLPPTDADSIFPEPPRLSGRPDRDNPVITESPYGTLPQIPVDANPAVAQVAESVRTGVNPERVSAMIVAPPFDLAAYRADPAAYLAESVPGRVWQSAQPGEGVPRLQRIGPRNVALRQGEQVTLAVQASAGNPVTFTSFDAGIFTNQLTSITVAANDEGVARATFVATPGVIENSNILVSSPLCVGQVNFNAIVSLAAAD